MVLSLTISCPTGPLNTSLAKRLRILTDILKPPTGWTVGVYLHDVEDAQYLNIKKSVPDVCLYTHTLSHTVCYHTDKNTSGSHFSFCLSSFCNHSLSVFLSLLIHIEALCISCIIPWTLPKDWEEGSRVNELTFLFCPLHSISKVIMACWSALSICRLWGYIGAATYLGEKQVPVNTNSWTKPCCLNSVTLTLNTEWWKAALRCLSDWVKAPTYHSLCKRKSFKKKQSSACDNSQDMDNTHSC